MAYRGRTAFVLTSMTLSALVIASCQNLGSFDSDLPEPEPISTGSLNDYLTAHPEIPPGAESPPEVSDSCLNPHDPNKPRSGVGDHNCPLPPVGTYAPGELLTIEQVPPDEAAAFFAVEPISPDVFARMDGNSWREGAISISKLRYLRTLYWVSGDAVSPAVDFVDSFSQPGTHIGEIIVNEAIADDVLAIFQKLYDAEYPIGLMVLIDNFGADDTLSMTANNTSGFNHRLIAGTNSLSNHAKGLAIDLNPVQNPWVSGNNVEPQIGGPFADRSDVRPLMINHDDLAYQLFKAHGFSWGGDWRSPRDYQHFEKAVRD